MPKVHNKEYNNIECNDYYCYMHNKCKKGKSNGNSNIIMFALSLYCISMIKNNISVYKDDNLNNKCDKYTRIIKSTIQYKTDRIN